MKFAGFIFYLILYSLNFYINFRIQGKQKKRFSMLRQRAAGFLSILVTFLFIWVLTGYINFWLIGAFILMSLLGQLISKILITFLASEDEELQLKQIMSHGAEVGMRYPLMFLGISLFALLFVVVNPVIIGIVYFSNEIPSAEGTQNVIKYIFTLGYVAGILINVPQVIHILISKNLHEDTRTMTIIGQIGGLLPTAMWLTLILWGWGVADVQGGFNFSVGEFKLNISPVLIAILFGYFGVFILIPYLIGAQRGKKWRQNLLKKQQKFLEKLTSILEFPKFNKEDLAQLQTDVKTELTKFAEDREIIEMDARAVEFENEDDDDLLLQVIDANQQSQHLDPRVAYVNFLGNFQLQLELLLSEITPRSRAKALNYARIYRDQKDEVIKNIQEEETRKPQVYAGIIFLLTAISGPIVGAIGKWAWETFLKTPN